MAAKKVAPPTAPAAPSGKTLPGAAPPVAWTLAERVQRIQAMGRQINGYIEFMCKAAGLDNTSAEARERAVTAFYERMVIVEKQLCLIHDEFRLE